MHNAIAFFLTWCLFWSAWITILLAIQEPRTTSLCSSPASYLPLRGKWLRSLLLLPLWMLLVALCTLLLVPNHLWGRPGIAAARRAAAVSKQNAALAAKGAMQQGNQAGKSRTPRSSPSRSRSNE